MPEWRKHSPYCSYATVVVPSPSCVWLCDPMACSMPSFPVLHYFLEFAQTRVHWVGGAIIQLCDYAIIQGCFFFFVIQTMPFSTKPGLTELFWKLALLFLVWTQNHRSLSVEETDWSHLLHHSQVRIPSPEGTGWSEPHSSGIRAYLGQTRLLVIRNCWQIAPLARFELCWNPGRETQWPGDHWKTGKPTYLGHMMRRADTLEKTLMLGKIEGRRRRGRQRMRWFDGH